MLARKALQGIEGTARFAAPVFDHMRGDHGRLDIRMTQPFLYLADIDSNEDAPREAFELGRKAFIIR